jgi:ketosteroid isomerase-like protein
MRYVALCILVLAAVAVVGGAASLGEKPEQMIAAAKALDKQFIDGINGRDVDGTMATCWNSPDYREYPPDTLEVRGWQAAKAETAKMFADTNLMPPGATFQVTEANYKVAGDVVIGWGKYRMKIPLPNGESIAQDGRYMNVVEKHDGRWVYILAHESVPFAPPASPSKP